MPAVLAVGRGAPAALAGPGAGVATAPWTTPCRAPRRVAGGAALWAAPGERLVRAVAAVEAAFWPVSAGRAAPGGVGRSAWRRCGRRRRRGLAAAPEALAWLLQGRAGARRGRASRPAPGGAVALALRGEPDVGSLDYNARNVVLDEARGRVTLLDFAATGVDWPERRLVQYATATGGGRLAVRLPGQASGAEGDGAPPGAEQAGTFRSALTAEAVRRLRRAGGAEAGREPGGGGGRGGRPRGAAAAGGGAGLRRSKRGRPTRSGPGPGRTYSRAPGGAAGAAAPARWAGGTGRRGARGGARCRGSVSRCAARGDQAEAEGGGPMRSGGFALAEALAGPPGGVAGRGGWGPARSPWGGSRPGGS